ncbi:hypothetical protein DH2020_040168 [Rehmannia glutinosa]|uniref:phosphatidate phosphatase n=1 Tax=Rehmannia glutinosa TaxID=99300 RepID=A0ABR0UTM3_REHGL
MNVVGKVSSFITQGVYSVATPFHPFGGAVDIIVVKQNDGTFRSTPWYVRFGKFQGVLKGAEKVVRIEVNGVEANFHMHLDNSGEAYFVREVDPDKDNDSEGFKDSDNFEGVKQDNSTDYSNIDNNSKENGVDMRDERVTLGMDRLERVESDSDRIFYEFQDEQSSLEGSVEFSEYGSSRYESLDSVERALDSQNSSSEVVLVSVDGHILTAPISSSSGTNAENVQLSTPQFHLGPGEGTEEYNRVEDTWTDDYLSELDASTCNLNTENICEENKETLSSERHLETQDSANRDKEVCIESSAESTGSGLNRHDVFKSCLELSELSVQSTNDDEETMGSSMEILGAADDPNKISPPVSPSMNDEPEVRNLEISRDDDKLSPQDSGNPRNVLLPELEVETRERNDGSDSMRVEIVSNDQESLKQVEVDPKDGKTHSGVESPASDVCSKSEDEPHTGASIEDTKSNSSSRLELSLCGKSLHAGMGLSATQDAFNANRVSLEDFKLSAVSIVKNENLIVRLKDKYLPWDKATHIILGMAAFGLDIPVEPHDVIPVEQETHETKEDDSGMTSTPSPSRRWRLWPIPFRRVKTLEHSHSNSSTRKFLLIRTLSQRANARLQLPLPVEAHIYLWKWNTRIVISDVDGTITKSDVLGQFMPLVGKDWTHSGIAHLFSAIKCRDSHVELIVAATKENGYQLLFLSARAIVQAYLTKSFLFNLKQDGKSLPNGPVVISPDGLFPSLYREVIRRAPHEFKIACLEDIKALFPPDYNPFYAGFGNRDTDELSYRKIGIPKGKIFIINPKGEVAINHRIDVKSYTSLHTLVNDMFPPTSLVEQEDYNSWNYWKMPLPDIDNL